MGNSIREVFNSRHTDGASGHRFQVIAIQMECSGEKSALERAYVWKRDSRVPGGQLHLPEAFAGSEKRASVVRPDGMELTLLAETQLSPCLERCAIIVQTIFRQESIDGY